MLKINFMLLAALLGSSAVLIGAFAAHGLAAYVDAHALQRFHTGVEYQFYHVFALLFVGLLYQLKPSRRLCWSGILFMVGIVLFSGSLYAYVLTDIKQLGMITPFGGLAFIAAWILLALTLFKERFFE
jgi:uncharacterized membrane protein YgdD (TMEM256/DUF423 family)